MEFTFSLLIHSGIKDHLWCYYITDVCFYKDSKVYTYTVKMVLIIFLGNTLSVNRVYYFLACFKLLPFKTNSQHLTFHSNLWLLIYQTLKNKQKKGLKSQYIGTGEVICAVKILFQFCNTTYSPTHISGHIVSNTGRQLLEELQCIQSKGDKQRIAKLTTTEKKLTKALILLSLYGGDLETHMKQFIQQISELLWEKAKPKQQKLKGNAETLRQQPHCPVSDRVLLCNPY